MNKFLVMLNDCIILQLWRRTKQRERWATLFESSWFWSCIKYNQTAKLKLLFYIAFPSSTFNYPNLSSRSTGIGCAIRNPLDSSNCDNFRNTSCRIHLFVADDVHHTWWFVCMHCSVLISRQSISLGCFMSAHVSERIWYLLPIASNQLSKFFSANLLYLSGILLHQFPPFISKPSCCFSSTTMNCAWSTG